MEKYLIINKPKILEYLDELLIETSIENIRNDLTLLKKELSSTQQDQNGFLNIDENGETIKLPHKFILKEIEQIQNTHTLERTKYYIKRLKKSISEKKTNKINDINLNRWKEYENIITDSLWVLQKRDSSGSHSSWYWGNFIPQIPHQLMLRYTKKGEWIIDPFAGSGTTLLECQRLGRNGLGVELIPDIAERAKELLKKGWDIESDDLFSAGEKNQKSSERVKSIIEIGNSEEIDFRKLLKINGGKTAQLVIFHPPYHDIIKFSDNPNDISNALTTNDFINKLGKIIENTLAILDKGRYFAIVIGDKYSKGEWIPLGFLVMNDVLKRGYKLKSIIVKNFEETLGKRTQKELWRYRAMVGGFYIFKHEYIFIFKK